MEAIHCSQVNGAFEELSDGLKAMIEPCELSTQTLVWKQRILC